MSIEIVKTVDSCLECPEIKTGKEWKKLRPPAKFFMKTSIQAVKILPTCPHRESDTR